MNMSSVLVLALLFSLVGIAVWRGWKKGSPCACGGSGNACNGCCACRKMR